MLKEMDRWEVCTFSAMSPCSIPEMLVSQHHGVKETKQNRKKCPCHNSFPAVQYKYTFTWQICTYSQKSAFLLFSFIEPRLVLLDNLQSRDRSVRAQHSDMTWPFLTAKKKGNYSVQAGNTVFGDQLLILFIDLNEYPPKRLQGDQNHSNSNTVKKKKKWCKKKASSTQKCRIF